MSSRATGTAVIGLCLGMALNMSVAFCAQPPAVQWSRTFTGLGAVGYGVEQTSDGGYIVVGTGGEDTAGGEHLCLVRTDSLGSVLWERIDSGASESDAHSVAQTLDGGYVMTGSASRGESSGVYLVKMNSAGNTSWARLLDNEGAGFSIAVTGAGDFLIAALLPGDDSGISLIKTDSQGSMQWKRKYRMSYGLSAENIPLQQTADGGYVIGAKTFIKVDSLGYQQWQRSFESVWAVYSVLQADDGGYVATGFSQISTKRSKWQMCLLRTDSLGTLQWKKLYTEGRGSLAYSMARAASSGYVVSGYVLTDSLAEGYIWGTDANGNELWSVTLGDASANCIRGTKDGGYVITGCLDGAPYLTKLGPELRK
jgi:hypothetical protein